MDLPIFEVKGYLIDKLAKILSSFFSIIFKSVPMRFARRY